MAGKAVIVLTSHDRLGDTGRTTGAYMSEIVDAWRALTAAGYALDLASVRGGTPPLEAVHADDSRQRAFLHDPEAAAKLAATLPAAILDPASYDIVFFAGGHGAAWDFPGDPGVRRLAREAVEGGGVLAAVCHGPAALVDAELSGGTPLLKGRRATCFSNAEERAVGMTEVVPFLLADRIAERGGEPVTGPSFMPHVVVDGPLVTGQNPASATAVAEAAISAAG